MLLFQSIILHLSNFNVIIHLHFVKNRKKTIKTHILTILFTYLQLSKATFTKKTKILIIKNYIYKDIFQKLVWIIGLLILIFASNKFVGFLSDAAEGNLPADMVFMMLGYKILASLPKIFPISILMAVLLVFTRMANDKELVVLEGAGGSKAFQMKIVGQFTVVFCLFVALMTLYVAPWAEQNIHLLKERAKEESDISGIRPGQFKEFSRGDRVVYVQNFLAEKSLMEDVFLQVRQEENLGVLASDNAYFQYDRNSGNKYIVFNDGQRYVGEPDTLDYEITEYEKYAILIENLTRKSEILKTSALTTEEIISSDNMNYKAEFQWRISLIIICFCLSLFSVLLVQSSSNEKRYAPFVIGISVYLIYSNLLGIAQTLLRREIIPEFVGLWSVHIIFILLLFILYYFPKFQLQKSR